MKLRDILASASPEVPMNENFEALDPAATLGINRRTTTGLTFGWYGGQMGGVGGLFSITPGILALSASATNFIEIDLNGNAVTKNTTGFTVDRIPLYTIVTSATGITTITDQRCFIAALATSGRIRVSSGSAFSTDGTGVIFAATQVPSTNPNTLDDYEEGNWTPTLGGTATYTVQTGRYIKIGKQVTVWGRLVVNAIGTGSTTTISGLPFAAAASGFNQAGSVGFFTALTPTLVNLSPVVVNNTSTLTFNGLTAAATGMTATIAIFQAASEVNFQATYEAAT